MGRAWFTLSIVLVLASATVAGARSPLPPGPRVALEVLQPAVEAPAELAPDAAVRKASVEGKYQTLLSVIRAPEDLQNYTAFNDYGLSYTATWAGYSGLPKGHWVYVYPHWYIWKTAGGGRVPGPAAPDAPLTKRAWGPEQATGEPDTDQAGDIVTAWASATQDGQDEWLDLEYAATVTPVAVIVHETFNPGAVSRVLAVRADTEEVEVWKGADPTPVGRGKGVSILPIQAEVATSRIKVFIDSTRVPGWNEIDAVGLIDQMGKTHWATRATASTTYAAR